MSNVVAIRVAVPPDASESKYHNLKSRVSKFDTNLIKECDRIIAKPASEQEGAIFADLRAKIENLQPKNASTQYIALDLLNRYTIIMDALKAHAIWNANPRSAELLKTCAAEIKELVANYSLDMTAKELSSEDKQAFLQPTQEEPNMNEAKSPHM